MARTDSRIAFWKRTGGAGALAVDFAADAISLHVRGRGGWEEVGRAPTDAPDFAQQVDALRVEALVRDKTQAPITMWLPADQIIERHYQLTATTEDGRRAEAARRIASETTHLAAELSVAVAGDSRTEPVKVLAVLLQTMVEARSYAANWGFNPGPISTQVSAAGFGPGGPIFEFPRSAVHRAGRTFRQVAVAASVLAVAGAAAFGGYYLVQPLLQSPVEVRSTGPAPSSFAVFLDPPPEPQAPFRAVTTGPAGNLGQQRTGLPPETFEADLGTSDYARIPPSEPPGTLAAPPGTVPLKVGTAPAVPAIGAAGELADLEPVPPAAVAALTPNGLVANVEDLSPTEFAPEEMAGTPPPRPVEDDTEAESEVAAVPEETPEVPPPRPEIETTDADTPAITVPDDVAAGGRAAPDDAAPDNSAAAATLEIEPVEVRPSVFAAVEAPPPSKRPRTLEFAAKRLPARTRTAPPLSVYLPRAVSDAAKRTGLALDETSLLGIIDAKTGRRALVRLSDGGTRMVTSGDEIDGLAHLVDHARGRLRLTRQGQRRTLVLVAP